MYKSCLIDGLSLLLQESGASYCQISAMYSELVVLDTLGKVHQWKWTEQDPYSTSEVSTQATSFAQYLYLNYEQQYIFCWHTFISVLDIVTK